jgi:hypothetical protein
MQVNDRRKLNPMLIRDAGAEFSDVPSVGAESAAGPTVVPGDWVTVRSAPLVSWVLTSACWR